MKFLMMISVIFILLPCSICYASDVSSDGEVNAKTYESVVSTQASVDFLTFTVTLKKQTFIQDEPIEARFMLRNNADNQRRLAEPAIGGATVFYKIFQLEGQTPMQKQPEVEFGGVSKDYSWLFNPGEYMSSVGNILEKYPITLSPGRYALEVIYYIDKNRFNQVDWYGNISLPLIKFTIIEPSTSNEVEARYAYLQMKDKYSKKKNVIGMYSEFDKIGNVGLFSKYAEFLEILAYASAENLEESKIRLTEYINKYGNDDVNSIIGINRIASKWQIRGNYYEARKMYELLPEGYNRSSYIKVCDMKLAKSAESSN